MDFPQACTRCIYQLLSTGKQIESESTWALSEDHCFYELSKPPSHYNANRVSLSIIVAEKNAFEGDRVEFFVQLIFKSFRICALKAYFQFI